MASGCAVQKKKLKKQGNKKRLFDKIFDYLKSDSYMFAPLISPQPSDFFSADSIPTAFTGVETRKPIEENDKKFVNKIEKYLECDCYMYAPSIVPQSSLFVDAQTVNSPSTEPICHLKREGKAAKSRKISREINQPTEETANVVREIEISSSPIERNTVVRQTLAHQERVKYAVQQNCRSPSLPG